MGSETKWLVIVVVLLGAVLYNASHGHTLLAADGADPDWDSQITSRELTKPTVLFFTASWCPHCHELSDEVFAHAEVQDYLARHYNFITIETTTAQGHRLEKKFGVHAYPTLVRYDPAGHETARRHGGPQDQIVAWLKDGE